MKLIDLIQNTPEWIEYRKNHIGASDAPIIMEMSPWKTSYDLWMEKVGIINSSPINIYQQRGKNLEEEARLAFENLTGLMVFPAVGESESHEWMMASFDGITLNNDVIVEIKCPGDKDHNIALSDCVPEKYVPQLQHQMFVSGLDEIYYFSYRNKDNVAVVKIYRDNAFIDLMIAKEEEFLYCMMNFCPP